MPPVTVPNGIQVRLIWQLSGADHAVNVLGARAAPGTVVNQALASTLGAAIKAAFTSSNFDDCCGVAYALARVGVRDVRQPFLAEFFDVGAAVAGSLSEALLPPQVAYCVTLRTAGAGPRFRGRVFLSGFTQSMNAGVGVATAAVRTNAVAFLTAVDAAMTASGIELAVLSRPNPDAIPANPGDATIVTSIVGRDLVWDTQRRRATPGI